ncbi:hypothetical protein IJG29_04160 [Candidatus Saccharibacteria bacterium]|nr:hypothetical protein [Candidatus Saccharibacteria bacterium]
MKKVFCIATIVAMVALVFVLIANFYHNGSLVAQEDKGFSARPVLIEPTGTRSADFETYEEYREFMDQYFSHVENDTSAFAGHGSINGPTPVAPPVTYTTEDGTVHSVADDPTGVS